MEAIGAAIATIEQASVVATTIAQVSATVSQEGPSNLRRFKAHHPPTLKGGGDRKVGKILEAMEITSDSMRIRLATF